MKKLFIILIAICNILLISLPCLAQEVTIDCDIYDIIDYHGVRLYNPAARIVNFWWTGKEYLWVNSYNGGDWRTSDDLENWSSFDLTSGTSLLNKHSKRPYSINYRGGKYVIYTRTYEIGNALSSYAERGEEPILYPLIILDDDFNLIESIDFDEGITSASYVDGKFYLQTQTYTKGSSTDDPINTVYVSDDALSWQIDESLTEVPLSNGTEYDLIFEGTRQNNKQYYTRSLSTVQNTAGERTAIIFENSYSPLYKRFRATDNLYVQFSTAKKYFKVSCDGIYWLDIAHPHFLTASEVYTDRTSSATVESINDCFVLKDKILFHTTQNRLFEYNKYDLINAWQNAFGTSQVYVKYNNTFLGFETAPVIENDTTLIPIRFLFEQMGAEVEWNQETQTATISKDDTVIMFSIDNTTATVNGESVQMRIPARLINDKTMVPVRFLSEELGYTVNWDDESRVITIE